MIFISKIVFLNQSCITIAFISSSLIYQKTKKMQMDISTSLWTLAVILLTLCIYKRVLLPYKQYSLYRKIISNSYHALIRPYSILGINLTSHNQFKKDVQNHGDCLYTHKTTLRDYQLTLGTFKRTIMLDFYDPELIRLFYQRTLQGCYVKETQVPQVGSLQVMIGNGLLLSQGDEWKRKRKVMSKVFNYDFLYSKIDAIQEICLKQIQITEEHPQNTGKSQITVDVNNLLSRIFGNVVIRCFFGQVQLSTIDGVEVFKFLNDLFEMNVKRSFSFAPLVFGKGFMSLNLRKIDRQFSKNVVKFKNYAIQAIRKLIDNQSNKNKEKDSNQGQNGVISLLVKQNLLKQKPQSQTQKDYYTIQDLINQTTTFFLAGTDTTANSTTILIYLLAQHPKVTQKLRQQIQKVCKNQKITQAQLKQMKYLDNCIKETLRMYSPTSGILPRRAVKDHYIGNIPVKQGFLVGLKIKPNHFKQEYYQNPFEFDPDRWDKIDSKQEPFSYFPFSSGNRNCIGQHLAMLQAKIAIIYILKRYKTITPQKPNFRKVMRTVYGAQSMTTTFEKNS